MLSFNIRRSESAHNMTILFCDKHMHPQGKQFLSQAENICSCTANERVISLLSTGTPAVTAAATCIQKERGSVARTTKVGEHS